MAVVEIVSGKLFWAPERTAAAATAMTIQYEELCRGQHKYRVVHYDERDYGRAFGPLGLDQTLMFCHELERRLLAAAREGKAVAVTTPPGDSEARCNAAVLFGAYLILRLGWTADCVAAALGHAQARSRFACSWDRKDRLSEDSLMTVIDCWAGLFLARTQGWIDDKAIVSNELCQLLCDGHQRMVRCFDAAWLVPGLIMVSADPVTTMYDPNPASFKDIFGPHCHKDEIPSPLPSAVSTEESPSRNTSTNTVCKDYSRNIIDSTANLMSAVSTEAERVEPFTTFLASSGVGLVIRTNFSGERGMPAASYDSQKLKLYGFEHKDIQFSDTGVGVPSRHEVSMALTAGMSFFGAENSQGGGLLVHCKGGFGRSMLIACCVAIDLLDISGRALLGWCRIARPGAINTVAQERFLSNITGRDYIRRFCGMSSQQQCCVVS